MKKSILKIIDQHLGGDSNNTTTKSNSAPSSPNKFKNLPAVTNQIKFSDNTK